MALVVGCMITPGTNWLFGTYYNKVFYDMMKGGLKE